jgi:hypothetical protein
MQNRYIQLAILALITLIFGWASLAYPFGPDQGVFAQIGRTILQGGLPIRDAFDVKPPVIYLLYALAEGMFGPNLWSIRVLDLLAVFLTSTCLLNIFKDRRQGLTAAALYPVVYFICFSYPDTAQTESFSNLFCTRRGGRLAGHPYENNERSADHPAPRHGVSSLTQIALAISDWRPCAGCGHVPLVLGTRFGWHYL